MQISQPLFINADTGGQNTGSFLRMLLLVERQKVSLPNIFSITPGRRYFLNVNLTKNAEHMLRLGFGKTSCVTILVQIPMQIHLPHHLQFWCKISMGRSAPAISQATDISTTSYISGWNSAPAQIPRGVIRIKQQTILVLMVIDYLLVQNGGVLTNNTMTRSGDWSGSGYGNAIKIGDNLLLPATGYRFSGDGTLNQEMLDTTGQVLSPVVYMEELFILIRILKLSMIQICQEA